MIKHFNSDHYPVAIVGSRNVTVRAVCRPRKLVGWRPLPSPPPPPCRDFPCDVAAEAHLESYRLATMNRLWATGLGAVCLAPAHADPSLELTRARTIVAACACDVPHHCQAPFDEIMQPYRKEVSDIDEKLRNCKDIDEITILRNKRAKASRRRKAQAARNLTSKRKSTAVGKVKTLSINGQSPTADREM